jgi:predicted permease
MDLLLQDLRYAARKLANTPGFTVTALLTLAIAIGAVTAVFSIVDDVLLEPLPFPNSQRLVLLESTDHDGRPMPASPTDLMDYRDRTHSFTAVAAVDPGESVTLTRPGLSAVRLNEARVGASFFSLLGAPMSAGRGFAPGEDKPTAAKTVVLSTLAWQRYFGGDPRIVGSSITLDGSEYRVIGIARPTFTYPQNPDVWLPAVWHDFEIGDNARGFHSVSAVARLANDATIESARRDVQAVANQIAREFPRFDAKIGGYVQSFSEFLVGDVRRALWAMFGAVCFVLLIACANVANLFLVRADTRESEIAVRTALGAGKGRLVRQLLTESLLLSAVGAGLGFVLASWIVDAVVAFGPRALPRLAEVSVDTRALGFAALLAIATGLLFGIVPALHAARSDIAQMLRERGRTATRTRSHVRRLLIALEMALAVVLLVGAGLLLRSFDRLVHVDAGFKPEHLVVFDVALAGPKYEQDAQLIRFADDVQRQLSALPGASGIAVAARRPLDPDPPFGATTAFFVDGEPKPEKGSEPVSELLPVSPSFFRTFGLQLVKGRVFVDAENRADAAPVIVINEALARRYFPNQNPIGKHLTYGLSHTTTPSPADSVRVRGEIVGIVRNMKVRSLSETPAPATYVAYNTLPLGATFAVQTSASPGLIGRAIREQLRNIDPNVAIFGLGTMDDALSQSVAQPRFYTILLGAFAGIALLLATLGVYGVIAYVVSQRTREFGIRIALGATSTTVAGSVLRSGLALSLIGVAVGVIVAVELTRVIQSMLFDVAALDPITFVAVPIVLGGAAVLASWLPARRAARVDPVIAMRAE